MIFDDIASQQSHSEERQDEPSQNRTDDTRPTLYFDGLCREDRGAGSIGYLVETSGKESGGGKSIRYTTQHSAEYEALIAGLRTALDMGITKLRIRGDARLVVKQIRDNLDVDAPELQALHVEAKVLLKGFKELDIEHMPRQELVKADMFADFALE